MKLPERATLLRQLDALNADLRAHQAPPDITHEAAAAMTDAQLAQAVERTADHLLTIVALDVEATRPNSRKRRPE